MSTPIPFSLHERLQRLLGITARSWGLRPGSDRCLLRCAGFFPGSWTPATANCWSSAFATPKKTVKTG